MIDIKKIKPRFITDAKGNKIEVIIPISIFQTLLKDLQDLAVRGSRTNEESITHNQLLEELKLVN